MSRSPSDRLNRITEERDQLREDLDKLQPRLSEVCRCVPVCVYETVLVLYDAVVSVGCVDSVGVTIP